MQVNSNVREVITMPIGAVLSVLPVFDHARAVVTQVTNGLGGPWAMDGAPIFIGPFDIPAQVRLESIEGEVGWEVGVSAATVVSTDAVAPEGDSEPARIVALIGPTGARLQIDETDPWDIHYWLTPEQIYDSRRPTGPTMNLTSQIQYAINELAGKLMYPGFANPANPNAGTGMILRFHHSYLVDGLDFPMFVGPVGDNMRDTIFVQSSTPNGHVIRSRARNGATSGARAPYHVMRDFSIRGVRSALGPGGTVCHGVWLENSDQDPISTTPGSPAYGQRLAHNAVLMDRVSVASVSGSCLWIPKYRHGPKVRFCYFQGGGGKKQINGVATTDDTGTYCPNVYDNSDSDGEYLHCGNGGGGGDSYFVQNGETVQFNGGDCWASNNPEQGYYTFRATGMDYLIIRGLDINGKLYYLGNGGKAIPKASQVRILGNNFRFRQTSFGQDDDTGQPAPLDAYVEFEDAPGVVCIGNMYTPYYDSNKVVAARPGTVYRRTGSSTVIDARDRFPPLFNADGTNHNDWPAGADLTIPNSTDTLCNQLDALIINAAIMDSIVGGATLVRRMRFLPHASSGIEGRTDGAAVPTGMVGEVATATVGNSAAVAIPIGANTDVMHVDLQPGIYVLSAIVMLQVAAGAPSVALDRIGLGTASGAITTTSTTTFAERQLNAAVAGNFDTLTIGPVGPVTLTVATRYFLVARCNYSGTGAAVQAIGHINVQRVG